MTAEVRRVLVEAKELYLVNGITAKEALYYAWKSDQPVQAALAAACAVATELGVTDARSMPAETMSERVIAAFDLAIAECDRALAAPQEPK